MSKSFRTLTKGLFALAVCLSPAFALADADQTLNPLHVVGFEVIVAGPCSDGFKCAFGHSFLRVVTRGTSRKDDPVLAFSTDAKEPKTFLEKTSFIRHSVVGLPILRQVLSLNDVWYHYSNNEKRTIQRIPLQMSEVIKERLIAGINELFYQSKEKLGDATAYNSLFANCAGNIVSLLNEAGVPKELFGIAIPSNLAAHFYRTYVALYPAINVPPMAGQQEFVALDDNLYRYCTEIACAEAVVQQYPIVWPKQPLEYPTFESAELERGSRPLHSRSQPNHWNGIKPSITRHFHLIQQASH